MIGHNKVNYFVINTVGTGSVDMFIFADDAKFYGHKHPEDQEFLQLAVNLNSKTIARTQRPELH